MTSLEGARPIRVLHVLAPAPVGGLEQVVYALASGHVDRGLDVQVATVLDADSGGQHDFLNKIRGTGAGVHPLVLPPRSYRRERELVAELCRSLVPDVVHTHGYRTDVVDGPVALRLGFPTVTTVHGFTGGGWKNRAYELLQRSAHRRFSAVVAVSRPLAAHLAARGVGSERLRCVPNAWVGSVSSITRSDARQKLGVRADTFQIGFVGRLSAEKGPDLFLEAFGKLADLPVAASIIGIGRLRRSLESRAAALDVAERVTWHGLVRNMAPLMSALDVLVLSSRTEGTPIVLFEAMAAGVPVVATRVGGIPDVVTGNEALLVAAHPDDLAGAIRSVFADPEAADRRAERARARLNRHFAMEPWLRRYEEVYREVIGRGARSIPTAARAGIRGSCD